MAYEKRKADSTDNVGKTDGNISRNKMRDWDSPPRRAASTNPWGFIVSTTLRTTRATMGVETIMITIKMLYFDWPTVPSSSRASRSSAVIGLQGHQRAGRHTGQGVRLEEDRLDAALGQVPGIDADQPATEASGSGSAYVFTPYPQWGESWSGSGTGLTLTSSNGTALNVSMDTQTQLLPNSTK